MLLGVEYLENCLALTKSMEATSGHQFRSLILDLPAHQVEVMDSFSIKSRTLHASIIAMR